MAEKKTVYMVSGSAEYLEADDGYLPAYSSEEEAGAAIVNGHHGEFGTRYVLRVELSVAVVYDRKWALVRREPEETLSAAPPMTPQEERADRTNRAMQRLRSTQAKIVWGEGQ